MYSLNNCLDCPQMLKLIREESENDITNGMHSQGYLKSSFDYQNFISCSVQPES